MPTREEMDVDVSIPARFEKVMQAVADGYGILWVPKTVSWLVRPHFGTR